jgi:hypothetical protein
MAIAYTVVQKGSLGNWAANLIDIALDATYAAGGYTIDPASCGLSAIAYFQGYMKTGENFVVNYNHTAAKIEILKGASTVTVTTGSGAFSEMATNDTYVSATTIVRALVIGVSASGI